MLVEEAGEDRGPDTDDQGYYGDGAPQLSVSVHGDGAVDFWIPANSRAVLDGRLAANRLTGSKLRRQESLAFLLMPRR